MHTPIAFFLFNRPDLTQRIFDEIARARPPVLLLIADGPRPDRPGDAEKSAATRAIVERVDWDCRILRNYSDTNLGCGRRQSSGMIWIFEQVEEAIILEDDTLPHPTFFPYCEEMLERYRTDSRVMHISGDNWLADQRQVQHSYYFSRYCLSWGWAAWRRAFKLYDPTMAAWPSVRDTPWLADLLGDPRAVEHWTRIFDASHAGIENVDTWDYQWLFTIWLHHGLAALPSRNLISNLGFNRADAAHLTGGASDPRNGMAIEGMPFPLTHPAAMVRDSEADRLMFDQFIQPIDRGGVGAFVRRHVVDALPPRVRQSLSSFKRQLSSTSAPAAR